MKLISFIKNGRLALGIKSEHGIVDVELASEHMGVVIQHLGYDISL